MADNELTVDLSIDKSKLDQQLEQIPTDILLWSRKAADDIEATQRAEAALKLVEARLSIDIRQNPVNYGFPKTTEELVKSLIITQQQYIDATNAVIEAKKESAASRAIVDALEMKRSSLKYLAELTVAGYLGSMTVQPKGVRN